MKFVFLLLSLFIVVSTSISQKQYHKLISELENEEDFKENNISAPFYKNELRLGIKKTVIDDNINKLSKDIKKVTVYEANITYMEKNRISKILQNHIQKITKNDPFEYLSSYKMDDGIIVLLSLEHNSMIQKILILTQENQKIRIYDLKTNIKPSVLKKMNWKTEYKRI